MIVRKNKRKRYESINGNEYKDICNNFVTKM